MSTACRVIVMAKAPLPGHAKTRLIPALGAEGAAALAQRLLARAVEHALEAALGPVELCCAPDPGHSAFRPFAGRQHLCLSRQEDGDLGARMRRALDRALAHAARVLLIGTDAPDLDAPMLRQAAGALDTHDAVFVPALDGGYALVGLCRPAPSLFDNMVWSTARVMADTRTRLAEAGLTHLELAPVRDIDEPADLPHVPRRWLP